MLTETKHIELNKAKWDKWADTLDDKGWRSNFLRQCQRDVISLMDLRENIRILDIGCGTGYALRLAAKLIDGNGKFFGVDLSGKMIEKAGLNFEGYENFQFIRADAESIPLDGGQFDFIICTNSFHHYLHPQKVMEEMKRLLTAGGKLYILDPTMDSIFLKIIGRLMHGVEKSMVKLYSTEEFKNMMIGAGLKYVGMVKVKNHQKVHIAEKF